MSYYNPSFEHTMVRGRGGYSPRSYRGSSGRGNSSWSGGSSRGSYGRSSDERFSSSFGSSYDKGGKFGGDRFSRGSDEYHRSYRPDGYSSRESHRSPDRKRPRTEGRHDSYGSSYNSSGRYSDSNYSERRGYSGERHGGITSTPYPSRRDEFRKPSGPPPRGSYRGRISSRGGSRGMRRDRGGPPRRRLVDSSYAVRKRGLARSSDFGRRSKIIRMRSTMLRRKRAVSSEKAASSDEEKEKDETKEKKDEDEDETEEKEGEQKEGEEKEKKETKEKDGELKEKKAKEREADKPERKKNYIKLVCPQCNIKVPTFRRYEMHLQGKSHLIGMRRVAMKQKSILAQMRQAQRNAQNELEKKGSNEDLTSHTQFCPLCKLNYKQHKSVHQKTEAHKNMKKFLMPFCKVCSVTFKSPMIYENHLCSIEHLKRKQRVGSMSDASGEEDNLEDFTTIDSVGDVEDTPIVTEEDKEKKLEKKKEKVDVGIEQIKKIEAYYCDLCRMYLPRASDDEISEVLSRHCKKRFHMQRYVRLKEAEELERRAEKLQRKETAEKEKKKVEAKKEAGEATESKEDGSKGEVKGGETNKATEDDKLWEAVDKDLGELLENDGNKSEDDDDDDSHVNGERYDRFKLSEEKEKNEEENKSNEEPDKPAEEAAEDNKEEEGQ